MPFPLPGARRAATAATIAIAVTLTLAVQNTSPPVAWGYGGGPAQIRYSALKQINRGNVAKLALAWTYDTGEPG